jgi:hypothetical protein
LRERATIPDPGRDVVSGLAPYILTIGAILLAWQIAIQPLLQRAPVDIAVRLAPGSPSVLRRAAEVELIAGRDANAASLARDAFSRAPFDVRALRVIGLTESRAGRKNRADDILTLAGNWSLRDDPTHAWLVEHRLRQGDYFSAFAHADTLVRRRGDMQTSVFRLFTVAAVADRERALPVVAELLAANPPWRSAYLTSLYETAEGLPVAAALAVTLQAGRVPKTNAELQELYLRFLEKGQIEAVKAVRERLRRPPPGAVTNGGFDSVAAPEPFHWLLAQEAGVTAAIMADDVRRGEFALRVEYDGYTAATMARQRTFLSAGRYRFGFQSRTELGNPADRMVWTITCGDAAEPVLTIPAIPNTQSPRRWAASSATFLVPDGCASQWLELRGSPLDTRASMVAWFDRVSIISDPE